MTPKREMFCQEYLLDLNAAAAARRAGFSVHTSVEQGAQLMAIEEIQERIKFLMEDRSRRLILDQDFVVRGIVEIAMSGTESGRLKAFELLGKHQHMFNEKIDVNIVLARKAEEYAKLTPGQQLELMREEVKRLESEASNGPMSKT